MKENIVYKITNPQYQQGSGNFSPETGYLIVGEIAGKAVLNHFSESARSHDEAIDWYSKYKIPVARVFCDGQILKLAMLKDELNNKPINEVIGKLEKELLI